MASTPDSASGGKLSDREAPPVPDDQAPGGAIPFARSAAWQARCLLRAARSGCLATTAKGQPFASLVTPACMPDGSLLLLLSRLSEHTRHLMADPRCSIMVSGEAASVNPQTTPRVTVTGVAEVVDDAMQKARYLAVHPYASLYVGFGDFSTWRVKPAAGLMVGGFGRAARLKATDLAPEAEALAAIAAAEPGILSRCNQDHRDALSRIAGEPGEWRMVTADVDGFDMVVGERVVRFAWSAPIKDAGDVAREMIRIAGTDG